MESTPKHISPSQIQEKIRAEFSEIKNIHDFHVWEISSHLLSMTAHLEVNLKSLEESKILLEKLNQLLHDEYGIAHTTFQLEPCAEAASRSS